MTNEVQKNEVYRILLVEDDDALSTQVRLFLTSAGYDVTTAPTVSSAEAYLQTVSFDLLLLDWKLPDGDGLSICQRFREKGNATPVLMLTAEDQLDNKVSGFGAGVDDYLTKPYSPRELLARVKSILKRPPSTATDGFRVGSIHLSVRSNEVYVGKEKVALLPKEFALLEFFMRHPDQYFTAESLLSNVWTAEAEVGLATVRVQINNLRKKLDIASNLIQNSPGLGYRLAVPKNET